jgi:hypothetical protein
MSLAKNSRFTKSGAGRCRISRSVVTQKAAPATDATRLSLANQMGDAFAAGHHASVEQLRADTGHAVGLITGGKRLSDFLR